MFFIWRTVSYSISVCCNLFSRSTSRKVQQPRMLQSFLHSKIFEAAAHILEVSSKSESPSDLSASPDQIAISDGSSCLVCNDCLSSQHTGIAACNPCQAFFSRAVKLNEDLKCRRKKNCIAVPGSGSCRYCRFQRCLKIGMDPSTVPHSTPYVPRPPPPLPKITDPPEKILSQYILLEDIIYRLRQSQNPPFFLLDVMSRPAIPLQPSTKPIVIRIVTFDMEIYGVLEWCKAVLWMKDMGFEFGFRLTIEKFFPLLALRCAWYRAATPHQDEYNVFLEPLIQEFQKVDLDACLMGLLSSLLLSNSKNFDDKIDGILEVNYKMSSNLCLQIIYERYGDRIMIQTTSYARLLSHAVIIGNNLKSYLEQNKGSKFPVWRQLLEFDI